MNIFHNIKGGGGKEGVADFLISFTSEGQGKHTFTLLQAYKDVSFSSGLRASMSLLVGLSKMFMLHECTGR